MCTYGGTERLFDAKAITDIIFNELYTGTPLLCKGGVPDRADNLGTDLKICVLQKVSQGKKVVGSFSTMSSISSPR